MEMSPLPVVIRIPLWNPEQSSVNGYLEFITEILKNAFGQIPTVYGARTGYMLLLTLAEFIFNLIQTQKRIRIFCGSVFLDSMSIVKVEKEKQTQKGRIEHKSCFI